MRAELLNALSALLPYAETRAEDLSDQIEAAPQTCWRCGQPDQSAPTVPWEESAGYARKAWAAVQEAKRLLAEAKGNGRDFCLCPDCEEATPHFMCEKCRRNGCSEVVARCHDDEDEPDDHLNAQQRANLDRDAAGEP